MSLTPLVSIRIWLRQTPWLWEALNFLGHHARDLMIFAVAWIALLMLFKVRRSGEPTAPEGVAQEPAPPPSRQVP